jgi:hypothetical protein
LIEECAPRGYGDVKDSARVLVRQPVDCGENNTLGDARGGADPQFAGRRIGQKLDFPDPLIEFVECSNTAFEESAAILRELDALRTAVEQWYAENLFSIGERSRNGRLGYRKSRCRLGQLPVSATARRTSSWRSLSLRRAR